MPDSRQPVQPSVYIVSGKGGEWTIQQQGRKPTLGTFLKKETAIARAIKEARASFGLSPHMS